jgi:mono/diheme cytochrome c family protein
MGPTAMLLNPYPRDYRPGVFKFKSTATSAQPTDDDLRRVLHNGVPGTAMPSFALLPPDEIESLVEYVKYLSMRGQLETQLLTYAGLELDPGAPFDPSADADLKNMIVGDFLGKIVTGWKSAAENIITPKSESIPADHRSLAEIEAAAAKGRELFFSVAKGNCFLCHGPTALGDGQQTDYDIWSKAVFEFIKATESLPDSIQAEKQRIAELEDDEEIATAEEALNQMHQEWAERQAVARRLLPPRNAIPRNLREGLYRGGGRPIDFFWRVSAGIHGTPMPAAGAATPGSPSTMSEEEIWQIVEYVQSLPFEPASRPAPMQINIREVVR